MFRYTDYQDTSLKQLVIVRKTSKTSRNRMVKFGGGLHTS